MAEIAKQEAGREVSKQSKSIRYIGWKPNAVVNNTERVPRPGLTAACWVVVQCTIRGRLQLYFRDGRGPWAGGKDNERRPVRCVTSLNIELE